MSNSKAEVSLYHLTTHPLEKVLPKLLEKVYEGNLRALIVTNSKERGEALNASLWTYSSSSFLPHAWEGGSVDPIDAPLWIDSDPVNKNNASVLILTEGRDIEDLSAYSRCIDIFDGNDTLTLASALERKENYQHKGHSIVYWKQSLDGSWGQA